MERCIASIFPLQFVLVFVTLLVHRRGGQVGGDGGSYVFFGTAGISMQKVGTYIIRVLKKKKYGTMLPML